MRRGKQPNSEELLKQAVRRVAGREEFMAALFKEWSPEEEIDFEAICTALNCRMSAVIQLGLCYQPNRGPAFREDITKLSMATGIEALKLAAFVREVDTLSAFRIASGKQMLAAARDLPSEIDPPDPE